MKANEAGRELGKITSVTADRFVVELSSGLAGFTLVGFDGQHYVARIGSFVLIPLQTEYVVGEITGLRDADITKGGRFADDVQGSHELASVKYLDVIPIGTLSLRQSEPFKFGVSVYPPLYSDVLYAQSSDLDRIFDVTEITASEFQTDELHSTLAKTAFNMGMSVIFDDYAIRARFDEFFGAHSAILGNTGSGKSCTVATIIQSVLSDRTYPPALGATFFVFDTNGEYRQAFYELPAPIERTYLSVSSTSSSTPISPHDNQETTIPFRLPHWFMSVEEWALLLRASDRAQLPILRTALGLTTMFADDSEELTSLKDHVLASSCLAVLRSSDSVPAMADKVRTLLTIYHTSRLNLAICGTLLSNDFGKWTGTGNSDGAALRSTLESCLLDIAVIPDYQNKQFNFGDLNEALELAILYEESHGNRQIRDYCSSLLTRYKSIRDRSEFSFLLLDAQDLKEHERSPETFVDVLLGNSGKAKDQPSQVVILDMNDIEDEIIEVLTSVVARLIFDKLRRYEPRNTLPVNLVLEEAHRYVSDTRANYAIDANKIFERIAKEGRKYGLFIMLASQRPSELSGTVLSQCSNFIVHRIQNPEDLLHIRQMTPFISESVLRRLPSLPKQHALIFGNAVNVPTTFRVRDADPRPKSDDTHIRELWFKTRSGQERISD